MHRDQLTITTEIAAELVARQFPDWRGLPITEVASEGTTNAIFRIGDRYVARFPLEYGDVDATRRQLETEANAADELLGRTRFRTPEPVALGEPGAGYLLPWSIQTWLPGVPASEHDPGTEISFAHDLADFIRGVRAIDTRGRTFTGDGRGGDLTAHDDWMETCFQNSEGMLDVAALRRTWARLRDLPPSPGGDVITHGDLIPGNLLVSEGRLSGVIDVGGLGPADPALDLVGAWHLLEPEPRRALRENLGCRPLEWERGKAWAFQQAMGLVWYYVDSNPTMSRMGRRSLERILSDAPAA